MRNWNRLFLLSMLCLAITAGTDALAQNYRIERVASGLDQPTYVTQAPGDPANIIYYSERITAPAGTGGGFGALNAMGAIYRYDMNTGVSTEVMSLHNRQVFGDEGLVGFAFSPDFNIPGSPGYQKIYVSSSSYNGGASPIDRVEEYVMDGRNGTVPFDGTGAPIVNRTILEYLHVNTQQNHTVNWIGFDPRAEDLAVGSPERNYLYIVTGDGDLGGSAQSRPEQQADDVRGKLLRVDVDPASGDAYPADPNKNFAIPSTNPIPWWNSTHSANEQLVSTTINYTNTPSVTYSPALGELYATGLRNSFRGSIDRLTGDFWAGDVGENAREEINFLRAEIYDGTQPPLDYGYAQREGTVPTNSSLSVSGSTGETTLQWDLSGGTSFDIDSVNPIREGMHASVNTDDEVRTTNRSAYIGGYVYRGPVAELQGNYFYSDFIHSNIFMLSNFDRDTPIEDYSGTNFNQVDGVAALGTRTTVATADAASLWQSLIYDPNDPNYTPAIGASFGIGRAVSFGEDNAGNLYIVDFGSNRGDASFGGDYPVAGLGEIFRIVPLLQLSVTIDRDTGAMTFSNDAGTEVDILGYQLTSIAGGIDPAALTPIADRLDNSMNGNGEVDDTNAWQITSAGGDNYAFSESSTGTAATLATDQSFTLSPADGWLQSIYEDVQLAVTLGDGSILTANVSFTGNGDEAFDRSDLDFNGVLDEDDWDQFRMNYFGDFNSLSIAASYRFGDLNGDKVNDYDDFVLFKSDYIAANGLAAFAALTPIPEPSSVALLTMGTGFALAASRRRYCSAARRSRRSASVLALATVIAVVGGSRAALADLTHLYSFNLSLNDAIGDADGDAFGNAAINGQGQLVLPGGANDYVALDGQAINISSYTDLTIEAWFTLNQVQGWQRVFDFGDRTVPQLEQGYIYYTPTSGAGQGLAVFANNGARTEASHSILSAGQDYHLAFVIDDNANGGSDTLSVYINGSQVASVAHNKSLSLVSDTFALIGESLVPADPNLNGVMDEFRIYDHALSSTEVTASFLAGPTPTPSMKIYANTVTGEITLATDDAMPIHIDHYAIRSSGGALSTANWDSLEDQDVGNGPAAGEGWDEAEMSNNTQLGELFLLGDSMVVNGSSLYIGHALDTSVFGSGADADLTFEFGVAGEGLVPGEVVYIDLLSGDFNDDGRVDVADYTVWRDNLGATSGPGLAADHSGPNGVADGVVDARDYQVWRRNFGASLPVALVTSSVPEPTSLLLLVGSLAAVRWWSSEPA